MKLPFSLFLAIKYLRPKRSMVSVITVLTMLGIALGVAVLIVVLAVMTGFDDVHKEHMIRLDSHIKVYAPGGETFAYEPVMDGLRKMTEITAAAPSIEGFVMMTQNGQAVTAMLRGIDPDAEQGITDINQYLTHGLFNLDGESVILGSRLAQRLQTWVGDTLTVYSPQCFVSEDELRLPVELTVAGIFSIGMYEVDSQLMIASLPTARDVFAIEMGVQAVRVLTHEPYKVATTSRQIEAALAAQAAQPNQPDWLTQLRTETWIDLHRDLINTLQVEKDMMFILFCFIFIVASFSITNSLITLCVQKTHEIGLLKSLGFSSSRVVGVFFLLGTVQGIFGCVFGVLLGWAISSNLNPILEFARRFNPSLMAPEFYQFTDMPARMTLADSAAVCIVVLVFSTLAGALPAWRAATMEPVDALRHE